MKMRAMLVGASSLALLCACGETESRAQTPAAEAGPAAASAEKTAASAPATELAPVTAEERALMIAALRLQEAPGGKVVNDCSEAIDPGLHAVDMGGAVGRALLFVMGGGPNSLTCYGMTGMQFRLFRAGAGEVERLHTGLGHFAPMETRHDGVRDFTVGGPGFAFPAIEWNGAAFVAGRSIPDTEFPPSLN